MLGHNDYNSCIKDVIFKYYKVNENVLSQLYNLAEIKHYKKNETILHIGKTANEICILYSGAVIAYFLDEAGNAYNKNIFLEHNLIGSTVSYLTNSPSKFALEAIDNCVVISFNYKKYRNLIFSNDDFKNYYISYLEKQWIIDKEKREIDIVMKDASIRYKEFIALHPNIDEKIPLNHIASHLGITARQLSRIRKNIK